MNDSNLVGINEEGITRLMAEIYDDVENINHIFNSIDDIVAGTSQYYNDDGGQKFRYKYNNTRTNYSNVIKNILNYAEDLKRVRSNTTNFGEELSTQINDKAAIESERKIEVAELDILESSHL